MFLRSLVFVLALGGAAPVCAQDANHTRLLASNCANCHGTDGRSQGGMPSLSGMAKPYIVQQMQEFKAGKRTATIMQQITKGYTEKQVRLLCEWYLRVRKSS